MAREIWSLHLPNPMPYAKLNPRPSAKHRICDVYVDKELGNEAVTYILKSGDEGSVHIDDVLEYNQDPDHLAELLSHKLTSEALKRIEKSGLSRRELARRLRTSLPQLYRLLDPTNTRKSLTQQIALLHVLDCEVDLIVTPKRAA
jgi:DNA-binding phage protein